MRLKIEMNLKIAKTARLVASTILFLVLFEPMSLKVKIALLKANLKQNNESTSLITDFLRLCGMIL